MLGIFIGGRPPSTIVSPDNDGLLSLLWLLESEAARRGASRLGSWRLSDSSAGGVGGGRPTVILSSLAGGGVGSGLGGDRGSLVIGGGDGAGVGLLDRCCSFSANFAMRAFSSSGLMSAICAHALSSCARTIWSWVGS